MDYEKWLKKMIILISEEYVLEEKTRSKLLYQILCILKEITTLH